MLLGEFFVLVFVFYFGAAQVVRPLWLLNGNFPYLCCHFLRVLFLISLEFVVTHLYISFDGIVLVALVGTFCIFTPVKGFSYIF